MDFEKTFPIKRIDSFEKIQKEIDAYGRCLCCQIRPYYDILKSGVAYVKIIEAIAIVGIDFDKTTICPHLGIPKLGEDIVIFHYRVLNDTAKDLVFSNSVLKDKEIPYFEAEPQLMLSLLNFGPLEIDEENNKLIDLIYANGR